MFGSETWAMAEMDLKRVSIWNRKGKWTCGRATNMENKN